MLDTLAAGTPVFDPAKYPRVYRLRPGWWWFFVIVGVGMTGSSIVGAWHFGFGLAHPDWLTCSVCAGNVVIGLVSLTCAFYEKVSLNPDNIEYRNILRTRRLRREDIAGYRIKPTQYAATLELIPKRPDLKKLKIVMIFKFDALFDAWLSSADNYDQIEREAALQAVASDQTLGKTPEERVAKLGQGRKIARALISMTIILSLLSMYHPVRHAIFIALLMILPWLAFGLCKWRSGVFSLEDAGINGARADLTVMLIMPAVALSLRAMLDLRILSIGPILQASVIPWLVMVLLLVMVEPVLWRRWGKLLPYMIFLGVYCVAAIAFGNIWLDRGKPHTDTVKVLAKRLERGHGGAWYFTVSPWAGETKPQEIKVWRDVYQTYAPGNSGCIYVYRGAFGGPWYQFGDTCGGSK